MNRILQVVASCREALYALCLIAHLMQWLSQMACNACGPSSHLDNSLSATEVTYHLSCAGLVLDRMSVETVWSK